MDVPGSGVKWEFLRKTEIERIYGMRVGFKVKFGGDMP
jgi:hypothetical protein